MSLIHWNQSQITSKINKQKHSGVTNDTLSNTTIHWLKPVYLYTSLINHIEHDSRTQMHANRAKSCYCARVWVDLINPLLKWAINNDKTIIKCSAYACVARTLEANEWMDESTARTAVNFGKCWHNFRWLKSIHEKFVLLNFQWFTFHFIPSITISFVSLSIFRQRITN